MANDKIHIFAEIDALLNLRNNPNFIEGHILKYIIKNQAEIILIMDEDDFSDQWNDSESSLRKLFDSFDLPKPRAMTGLKQIYSNPLLCYQLDPFAIWLLDKPDSDINKFREFMGVWALNGTSIPDDYFSIHHPREYDQGDVINGPKSTGWGNYLAEISKPIPPINSIVLNDRHLVCNTNESTAPKKGFSGLNNLKILLNELLPQNLKVPFHLFVICQHPKMSIIDTDPIVNQFVNDVIQLRQYTIIVEFVFVESRHKRALYSNYFTLYADRGFNAFCNGTPKILNGENDFIFNSYLYDASSSGDTEYKTARSKITKIKDQSIKVLMKPDLAPALNQDIQRVTTSSNNFFDNRLFS